MLFVPSLHMVYIVLSVVNQVNIKKTCFPNIGIVAQWYCHYAERIQEDVKVTRGLEQVQIGTQIKSRHVFCSQKTRLACLS